MKLIPALTRNAITVAALAALLLIIPAAQATPSPNERDRESFTPKAHRQSHAPGEGTRPFEFHSGFWLNLHHFLYEQALLRRQGAGAVQAANGAANQKDKLSTEERRLWDSAVEYYARSFVKRDFVHDDGMKRMNDQLAESEGAADLSGSGLSAELIKILEGVAPVYRARWWPQHDKANRFWIAVVTPMVQQFGRTLAGQLADAYKAKWPARVIRVDVAEYANWAGAYTTFDRAGNVHTTVCSIEPGNQSFAALEILFHEASHSMVDPNNGAVAAAIARESRAKNRPVPRDLWHAIIFYTAGELIKRDLREYGVSDYVPVAYRGLYERAWPNLQRPLELYWQPYLDGAVDFDKAVSNLINAL